MGALIILLFVLRVALDLIGLFRSGYELDGLYCVVMLSIGIVALFDQPLFGCVGITVGVIYGARCALKFEDMRKTPK